MSRLTLIWGVLLLAGIFMCDIDAEPAKTAPVQTLTITNTTHPTLPASLNTTHATSHAPSNTTKHQTTPAHSNTTHTPSNTTSHAPSYTTTHSTTPTTPVLPTRPSAPTSGNYTVKDANGTCIIADMGLALELDNSTTVMQNAEAKDIVSSTASGYGEKEATPTTLHMKWQHRKGKYYFNVKPKETHVNGTCSESRANLYVAFPEGSIHLVFVKDGKIYYIHEVSVNFTLNSAERWGGTARNLKLLSTDIGYFVKCKTTPTVKLADNLYLTMADVKLQAFNIHNGVLGKEKVCFPDRNKALLPVGVALAVVVLILIILLVFLLTRKRQSSGYERI